MAFSTVVRGKRWYLKRTFHEGRPFYFFETDSKNAISMPAGYEFGGVATKPHLPFIKKRKVKKVKRKKPERARRR